MVAFSVVAGVALHHRSCVEMVVKGRVQIIYCISFHRIVSSRISCISSDTITGAKIPYLATNAWVCVVLSIPGGKSKTCWSLIISSAFMKTPSSTTKFFSMQAKWLSTSHRSRCIFEHSVASIQMRLLHMYNRSRGHSSSTWPQTSWDAECSEDIFSSECFALN